MARDGLRLPPSHRCRSPLLRRSPFLRRTRRVVRGRVSLVLLKLRRPHRILLLLSAPPLALRLRCGRPS
eukprot:4067939-Prymnesium_polylepis.1